MTDNTANNDRDPIGTVAEEARKLFDAIQGRATRQVGKSVFNSFTGGGGSRTEKDVWGEAVSEPEDEYICRACPFCRAIAAQREAAAAGAGSGVGGAAGDVAGHIMAAGGELFAAFRQALDSLNKPATPRTPRDDDGRDNVEHIDLG
ncbi:hypothetical protein ACTMTF_01305 [Nonomuraea sp. ZG12]|uniref:hypothetical protein n=1 Tax=Nonomuraea sp. ZG12 TaxID=3452207 RepID=UPI003F89527A